MILPIITKEEFVDIINLAEKQYDKDIKFADFMETYLDGRFVPMMSDYNGTAVIKLLNYIFNDRTADSWIDWFFYETDFGKTPMSAWIHGIEYKITSPETMYDVLVIWMNLSVE
jgi:hypothetical protein